MDGTRLRRRSVDILGAEVEKKGYLLTRKWRMGLHPSPWFGSVTGPFSGTQLLDLEATPLRVVNFCLSPNSAMVLVAYLSLFGKEHRGGMALLAPSIRAQYMRLGYFR